MRWTDSRGQSLGTWGLPEAQWLGGVCFRSPGASVPAVWTSLQAADIQLTPTSAGSPHSPHSIPVAPELFQPQGGTVKGGS